MWQRFSERARKVVFYAQEEAQGFGEGYVSSEHLLLGLVREPDTVAGTVLVRLGISLAAIREEVERQLPRGDRRPAQDMTLTPRAKRVIDLSYEEARRLGNDYIGTEHLLLGLVAEGDGLAGRILKKLGVNLGQTRHAVAEFQRTHSHENKPTAEARKSKKSEAASQDPWRNYANSARVAIIDGFLERDRYSHEKLTAEHMILAILHDSEGVAAQVLGELGLTEEGVRTAFEDRWAAPAEPE